MYNRSIAQPKSRLIRYQEAWWDLQADQSLSICRCPFEAGLMFLTIILGGILGSITTFVGEQSQNHAWFSFLSLLIDFPVGLCIVFFIQALLWDGLGLLNRQREPVLHVPESHLSQEQMMFMMNKNTSSLKANWRVTFKTLSDASIQYPSKHCSDVSQRSSTKTIFTSQGDEDGVSRQPSTSSSCTTLLPVYLPYSSQLPPTLLPFHPILHPPPNLHSNLALRKPYSRTTLPTMIHPKRSRRPHR